MRRAALSMLLLAAAPALAAERAALRLEELGATRARPLFAPSRRPPPAAPTPAPEPIAAADAGPAAPGPAPSAVLTGVIIGGDLRLAVFQGEDGRPRTLREGETIEGWTIAAVQPRAIVIARDGEELELKLREPELPPAE